MNTTTKVLFKALRCLLRTSGVEHQNVELMKARKEYIESTIKMIDELLKEKAE